MKLPVLWAATLGLMFVCLSCDTVDGPVGSEFVYPLSVGTQWQYSYVYMYSYAPIGLSNQIHGSQTWQVVSATGIKPPFDATISVTRIDTVHNSLKNVA
ncbi:MAG TPA: hypothetical protein VMF59_04550, partial [Bacteroidota bacterium]|nr:hypothetical protein [Bacteroidota bacterium]